MKIDVIATPSRSPSRLIESLALGTRKPDMVSLVTNANLEVETFGLNVRLLRFDSDEYAVGDRDVALRCNVGLWSSTADAVVYQGDDQIASPDMLEESEGLLKVSTHFWGHHRYTTFGDRSVSEVMAQDPSTGRSREHGTNRLHLYLSCYSGMLGAKVADLRQAGGFDMAFNCRHAGEDQQLGRRLDGSHVYIHEPPYSWHPDDPPDWEPPGRSNVCEAHDLVEVEINSAAFMRCSRCPFQQYAGPEVVLFDRRDALIPYDHSLVRVEEEVLD